MVSGVQVAGRHFRRRLRSEPINPLMPACQHVSNSDGRQLESLTLAHSLAQEASHLHLISFDYGQKHKRELEFAKRAADRLGAVWTLIDLSAAGLGALLVGSALTDSTIAVPDGHYAAETMKVTIVPNRNAIMLAIACAAAESDEAAVVGLAVHAGDHFIYPDCRPEFVAAFEAMERLAMDKADLRIE